MTTWEQKFVRFVAERWVFQGSDPHDFTPRVLLLALGEDFISSRLDRHEHHGSLYSGYIDGVKIGYMRVPPGTVILEAVMRSLAYTRIDTVIGIGSCGALQPEIECGDIIVAGASLAGECLSPHYGAPHGEQVQGDAALTDNLASFMRGRELPVHQGPVVTTGAAFRETDEAIAAWGVEGYLGVELEASALFSLGNFLGVRTTLALLVTDSPVRGEISSVLRGSRQREAFVSGIAGFVNSAAVYR
ncbi:MAG: hypothetical protein C4534_06615 [Gaiellales bacterium]|nr:MAG: hypothetical protein C4534_06615 [Gaiellales bacterium]